MSYTYKIKYWTTTINASEWDNSSFSAPANKIYNLNTSNQFNSIWNWWTIYYRCNNWLIELSKDWNTRVNANQTTEETPLMTYQEILTMANTEWYPRTNTMAELNTSPEAYYAELSSEGHIVTKSHKYIGNCRTIDWIWQSYTYRPDPDWPSYNYYYRIYYYDPTRSISQYFVN